MPKFLQNLLQCWQSQIFPTSIQCTLGIALCTQVDMPWRPNTFNLCNQLGLSESLMHAAPICWTAACIALVEFFGLWGPAASLGHYRPKHKFTCLSNLIEVEVVRITARTASTGLLPFIEVEAARKIVPFCSLFLLSGWPWADRNH